MRYLKQHFARYFANLWDNITDAEKTRDAARVHFKNPSYGENSPYKGAVLRFHDGKSLEMAFNPNDWEMFNEGDTVTYRTTTRRMPFSGRKRESRVIETYMGDRLVVHESREYTPNRH